MLKTSNYEAFPLLSAKTMLGVILSKNFTAEPEPHTLSAEKRQGWVSKIASDLGITEIIEFQEEGKDFEQISIDLANDEQMAKMEPHIEGSIAYYIGLKGISEVRERIYHCRRDKVSASTLSIRLKSRGTEFIPFRNATILDKQVEINELFSMLNAQLGDKAPLGIYAFDMPNMDEPAMFFVGTKRAKLKGHLNMSQWRTVTDEEGLKLFNTLREPLGRIGRTQMVG